MKISNNIITSIACFRKHFEFREVWDQLDIFLRDLSPKEIPYPNAESELLYEIIKNPHMVIDDGEKIYIKDMDSQSPFSINDYTAFILPDFWKENRENRIRIVALFELAGIKLTNEHLSEEFSLMSEADELILSNGRALRVVEHECNGDNLMLKRIKISQQSTSPTLIDGVELKPGQYAYGVFSNKGLHKLLAPTIQNEAYILQLFIDESDCAKTKVYHKHDEMTSHLHNVISFCTVGTDNFAYIENNIVYCHHNNTLTKRLRDEIGFFSQPLFVESDDDQIIITMNDGSRKYVDID